MTLLVFNFKTSDKKRDSLQGGDENDGEQNETRRPHRRVLSGPGPHLRLCQSVQEPDVQQRDGVPLFSPRLLPNSEKSRWKTRHLVDISGKKCRRLVLYG